MRNLFKRSFSGVIYVTLFVGAILFSKESYIVLVSIFGLLAIWELSKMIQFKNIIAYLLFGITLFLILKRTNTYATLLVLGINIISSIFLIYQLFTKKTITFSTEREKLSLILRYIVFSFCFLILLPFQNEEYHPYIMICFLILIWVNDSFAFLMGKNFGKTKLFEAVSPKKTQEGFLGGLIFALITAYIISTLNSTFSLIEWLIIAIIISVIGTIGDLVESKFKRQAKVKDSGNIMPGHGGILDRLDSLLFAAPFVYLYINYII
ncbi:CDP-archaeol synthase [uncultured Polaribacter sp.]|uniref:phosphatidate cytidylyltransferase n=1 Tax=uncultured Polaribacter sp. TaxID=174711 RepID=UPI00260CB54A|nr:CDP-archaeol synthase [uncultured Polaribacter sp.]